MGDQQMPESLKKSLESTKVSYVPLGKCGLKVSIPILGAMSFGSKEWQPWVEDDEEKVFTLLKAAYDAGLNSWDTANVYSGGVSEQLIGKAIKKHNLPRHKLIILTKCFGVVGEEPGANHIRFPEIKTSKDYVNQGGLSRAAIFNAVNASLARLQTDYIDLLQIHRFDATVPVEETMKALHDLVQSGKVRYIGASSMWTFQFQTMQNVAEKHGWTKFVSMQNHYSLCYREEEREMNKYCHATGVGLIPWSPLYRGYLARPADSGPTARSEATRRHPMFGGLGDADRAIITRVEEVAKKKGWAMAQVALAWIVQKGTVPIVGFSSVDRMMQAVEVKGKELSEEEVKYLEELYVPKAVSGHA